MTIDDFLAINTGLSREQVREVETSEDEKSIDDKNLFDAKINNCGLVYVQDNGRYAVMRATRNTCVIVTHVRNGVYNGQIQIDMRMNDLLNLLQNNDGRNYDGYRCCP